jgi:hypothetical protein
MQATLLPDEWSALRSFFYSHQGMPFYFYNPRETVPAFSWDPSGMNTVGRYIVAFDGTWSETYGHERGQMVSGAFKGYAATVSLGLREIV